MSKLVKSSTRLQELHFLFEFASALRLVDRTKLEVTCKQSCATMFGYESYCQIR